MNSNNNSTPPNHPSVTSEETGVSTISGGRETGTSVINGAGEAGWCGATDWQEECLFKNHSSRYERKKLTQHNSGKHTTGSWLRYFM